MITAAALIGMRAQNASDLLGDDALLALRPDEVQAIEARDVDSLVGHRGQDHAAALHRHARRPRARTWGDSAPAVASECRPRSRRTSTAAVLMTIEIGEALANNELGAFWRLISDDRQGDRSDAR
jgi:hypothetical protein